MLHLVALLLLFEPMHFALEAMRVLPTIAYRGPVAIVELVTHALVAALATGGALALINHSPVATRVATAAIVASGVRVLQSLYWTALPSDTIPGQHAVSATVAIVFGTVSVWAVRRAGRASQ